ncbi:hypothetical protein TNCV_2852361 [Trichonephila clavipes]|nr:hypothetical protein TNCV_2852361 [Trichonephila clavipes]
MGTHHNQKMCWGTIEYEPHILVPSSRYALQQHREKWEVCIRAGFFNPTTMLQIPSFFLPLPRPGSSYSRRLFIDYSRLRFSPTKRGLHPLFHVDLSSSCCPPSPL